MRKYKELIRSFLILLSLLFVLVLFGCNQEAKVLDIPQNVRVEGKALCWDTVKDASGYAVQIDGITEPETVQSASFSLENFTHSAVLKVKAVGDGVVYTDSDWSQAAEFTVIIDVSDMFTMHEAFEFKGLTATVVSCFEDSVMTMILQDSSRKVITINVEYDREESYILSIEASLTDINGREGMLLLYDGLDWLGPYSNESGIPFVRFIVAENATDFVLTFTSGDEKIEIYMSIEE